MSSPHIEENLLERYAMGPLPEQILAVLEEHLLVCPDCQSRLVRLDEFVAAFREVASKIQSRPARGWTPLRRFPRLAWAVPAAALAAALLLMIFKPGTTPAAPAIVHMQALRGPEALARIAAGQPALLVFDVPETGAPVKYEVEVVDPNGAPVLTVESESHAGQLSVPVRKLGRGSYWVRVYQHLPGRRLLEEYALRVK
jgi:anti-sigma factor RsiW